MDYQVIFKDTFVEDLERMLRSIAVDNPIAASKLGRLIIQKAESLSFFPERHPRVRERQAIRRFIVKHHFKIFFRVCQEPRTVEILRCWDGRQKSDPSLLVEGR